MCCREVSQPALRENGPYIYPTWLPKLLAGLDRCKWKTWFQVHHEGRTWQRLDSDFNLSRYNMDTPSRCASAPKSTSSEATPSQSNARTTTGSYWKAPPSQAGRT